MPDDKRKIAILYDKDANYSPSNDNAILKFIAAAQFLDIEGHVINQSHLDQLESYQGLLIRVTTHPNNYAYKASLKAHSLAIPVVDDPEAILKGCDKIWQIKALGKTNVNIPDTWIVDKINYERLQRFISYPAVIKIPDGCFSQGVYLAKTKDDYLKMVQNLLATHDELVCQEFIKTDFDWRIGIFNHEIIFACQYYMLDDDWKIIKYDRKGKLIDGNHFCVSIENIPSLVQRTVFECLPLINNGLYGIDIKQTKYGVYVIEINDNPSIDAGVEDEIYGMQIYEKIMKRFV
jgi:glutathione synthase/RimK-type ligase-like ATP-grasp enzyme